MLIARPNVDIFEPSLGLPFLEPLVARHLRRVAARWLASVASVRRLFVQTTASETRDTPVQQNQAGTQTAARDTRVLIVEDESIVALELKMSLRRLGHDVVAVAGNAADAVYLAGVHRPDVILMDIRLKGKMDGIDAAAMIRMQWDTPLIFVTGQADEATILRAQKVSPAAYLNKPIAASELAETIALVVSKHSEPSNNYQSHTAP